MNHFDVDAALKTMAVYVDTREHLDSESVKRRLKQIGLPLTREKLEFGDYSAYCTLPNGKRFSLADKVAIERKMSLNELSGNLFQSRERFAREFQRMTDTGAKMYLLVENGSIDKIYNHTYRTKVPVSSYVGSLLAWLARYDCQIIFVKPENSGRLIHDILYREMKEHLKKLEE